MSQTKARRIAAAPPETIPILPALIRAHLGQSLKAAYAALREPAPPDRFAELIARLEDALAAQGDRDAHAFREGLLQALPSLQSFAVSLTRNPTAADDLVQDTLLRAWRSRARFQAGTNLGAWLFTIMRNALYSEHRRYAREVADSDGDHARRLATVPSQGGHLDLQDVQSALARLPPAMREALILVAIEDMTYEEAAAVMKCCIGTVKSRVWRARDQLAGLLGYTAAEIGADHLTLSALGADRLGIEA
ncbi:sigma-70 family RNA polymerase sigma factor [Methylobacterium planeticum]|uniref:RNA polymerase sigma factor n=1 Tax=Methylobacterium planeticum TaxID=2615211 RepID=A0A6N6MXC7_9HYPH|nr:sigma-70 family RNA polymerase sigma factor [Methylobacterium planeticum]KAB1074660.1 sigma-70 family RNA polymerase sigma factor [Methylobacterium planeticum]